jgi:hypothetical protein
VHTSALKFKEKLLERHKEAKRSFSQNHPHAKAFFDNSNLNLATVRQHSTKALAAGALTGALLLSSGKAYAESLPLPAPVAAALTSSVAASGSLSQDEFASQLQKILPQIHNAFNPPFLNPQEEKVLGKIIEQGTGVKATATLEGEHLVTSYGYIGAEQHLRRWPGDTISLHGELANVEGMAPGNGGFGYFATGMSDKEGIEREKYYVNAPLMYLPDWQKRLRYLVNWYKFRKMIVINPDNGRAVVGVMGDAGPAAWTGKHFGGSPEVMDYLGGPRYKKGRVLFYFVDDPNNLVPLGPVDNSKKEVGPKTLEQFLKGPQTQ